ncbi:restriction endonuclease S subunit [Cylindrospermum stagnale PCC 7417]|uniref:Restriction endonuclease S subunit n=1 Tax=Cylindrospermum stagnale PCC 7417 TaxID=56107 RepID=K9X423_9NOST|nr:restriction endonuclease subunit S [Cylindrospermum stagnale]AFZ26849.1 restriction endonuclease S subunit [Cylindrospermum stagnale PCC 7417]
MSDWEIIQINDLVKENQAELQTGPFGTQLKASEYIANGIPVINVRNIGYGSLTDAKLEFLDDKTAERLKVHRLVLDDIVFGRKGAVDRHILITKKSEQWIQGSDCLRLRIKSNKLSTKFLSYYFTTNAHKYWMEAQGSFGATMSSLNQDIVKRINIPIPPLPVQKKIAAILSAYDDLIENNNRRIAILEKMAEEIYREWFVRLRFPGHEQVKFHKGIPEGWESVKIEAICKEIRNGVKIKNLDGSTKYLGLENLPRESILIKDFNTADSVQSDKLLFKERDILFGKIRPYLHKMALANFSGACSSDTIVIRPKLNEYEGFILFTIFSDTFIVLATISSKGTKMPRADWDFLKKLQIILPETKILTSYQKKFDALFSLMCKCSNSNEILKQTRDRLLTRLISGKLSVEDLDIQFPPSMTE